MGKGYSWSNEMVSFLVSVEKIEPRMLPTLIGVSDSLDEAIAVILKSQTPEPSYWLYEHHTCTGLPAKHTLLVINLPENLKDAMEIEIEVVGTSSGCHYPGTYHTAPEYEDTRDIEIISLICYDENCDEIGEIEDAADLIHDVADPSICPFWDEFTQTDLNCDKIV